MPIKSILVAYGGDAAGSGGLHLGLAMARKYDAHLTGVVWHGPSPIESRYRPYMNRDVLDMLAERDRESIAAVRAEFEAHVAERGDPARARFLDLGGAGDFSLAVCARGYDVTLIGRRAADVGREHFAARPDVVALRSGRPVIVVPTDYAADTLNEHALVAWDGKRAAARALGDAMHILDARTRVTVLTVGDEDVGPRGPGDDVMTLLSHHGVEAVHLRRPVGRDGIARTLLAACDEAGAGLLVMGAYEHSKFSEDLLGGVTRDMLDGAHLPVLMSH